MNKLVLVKTSANALKVNDIIARSSGQITNLEFLPIIEITFKSNGTVAVVTRGRIATILSPDAFVYKVQIE